MNVKQVGLLLLPSLDAVVLLSECSDVCAHALHHHAVDGGVVLSPARPHRPGTQLSHTAAGRALLTSLFWKEDDRGTQTTDMFSGAAIHSPTKAE